MERASGVLMHISSLYGDFSIGSFGKEAKAFIDVISNAGFSWWQVLPFCPVDDCNSPYKSQGAFGGNPYFVDLEILCRKGLLTETELELAKQKQPYLCEFDRLGVERIELLKTASKRVNDREKIESYVNEHKYIEQFCRFMSLKEINAQKPWQEWTEFEPNQETLFMWKFIQYEFHTQWAEIKKYANEKGVKIIGDIPIYVSYDSADVWANKELFQLSEDGTPTSVAGVPPDYFCENGQLWGNPLYDWEKMNEDGFLWWKERMKHMLSMFDGVRIDHFRGIESYWSVPYGAKTAKEGDWKKGPGMAFVNAMNSIKGDKLIIAEDLGDITREVNELVKESGFPGMRVFQFGFFGERNSPHMPHNYNEKTIVYTGTHDNNTLLGYVWELDGNNRKNMLEYCGFKGENWDTCYDNIFRMIYASNGGISIFPIQDILGYGSDTRLNVPGRAENNWSFRTTREQLNNAPWNKFKNWNEIYAR